MARADRREDGEVGMISQNSVVNAVVITNAVGPKGTSDSDKTVTNEVLHEGRKSGLTENRGLKLAKKRRITDARGRRISVKMT